MEMSYRIKELPNIGEVETKTVLKKSLQANKALAEKVLKSEARTYYLTYKKSSSDGLSRVRSQDISDLKTYSPNPDESSWGELLSYSTHMAQVVSQLNMDVSN